MAKSKALSPHTTQLKSAPTTLKQGSIFNIEKVIFKGTAADLIKYNQREWTFKELYPFCEYDTKTVKGIVINQSCDLENSPGREPKIPYINVCLLEPVSSILKLNFKGNKDWAKAIYHDEIDDFEIKLVPADFLTRINSLKGEFTKIINNTHPWAFFLILKTGRKVEIRGVNLSKVFPIRMSHYKNILPEVTHELKNEFANSLGWKMAYLYGRIGTEEYSADEISKITGLIHKDLERSFKGYVKVAGPEFTRFLEKRRNGIYANKATYQNDLAKIVKKKSL